MTKNMVKLILVSVMVILPATIFGAGNEISNQPLGGPPDIANTREDFLGLGFGVGISLTVDRGGGKDRIDSASVVNGIVRVEDEDNTRARVMLESHYFFKTPYTFLYTAEPDNWGHGPFVALQPGTDEIIEAVGLGWMIGFKRPGADQNSSSSWNFGIGYVVDPNVTVLGDGIEANQPLPEGETSVRFKEETETGFLFLASFRF